MVKKMKLMNNSAETNWKYLAIVVAFALVTVSGILLLRMLQPGQVSSEPVAQQIPPEETKTNFYLLVAISITSPFFSGYSLPTGLFVFKSTALMKLLPMSV